jgi:hypothetical protein
VTESNVTVIPATDADSARRRARRAFEVCCARAGVSVPVETLDRWYGRSAEKAA